MILKLFRTYKDHQRVYFLTEYINGTDLLEAMRVLETFSEEAGKIYFACLLIIFQYLHKHNIIYRDLKPENIMIDEYGFPKLIDFGSAKIINGRTFTIIGTPHYMAPEIILGKGYSQSADIWSMGIILYELVIG
mmetsp:Transcript_29488/g.5330  ORF Transcript_29488/g.5330 Transcript_29488/m.5330 type:complete len:134 (+) Transcript_29488:179-580(+)